MQEPAEIAIIPTTIKVEDEKQEDQATESADRKSLKSTVCAESSDIDLPVMFEYDNWWLDAEKPMTDECLGAFLKKHF